jgi:hypothetical protein
MNRGIGFVNLALLLTAPLGTTVAQAAQPNESGLQGSYVGVVVDANRAPETVQSFVRSGNQTLWILDQAVGQYRSVTPPNNSTASKQTDVDGSQFQGRLDLPNNPVSIRGTVYVDGSTNVMMPTLSYDIPVGGSTNIYAGAGYAMTNTPGTQTPLGKQNGVVLTTGLETSISRRVVVFGDAKLNLNQINATPNTSGVRFQVGAGFRF